MSHLRMIICEYMSHLRMVTWLVHTLRDMTHSHTCCAWFMSHLRMAFRWSPENSQRVWLNSYICVLIRVTWLIYMCDMTHSYELFWDVFSNCRFVQVKIRTCVTGIFHKSDSERIDLSIFFPALPKHTQSLAVRCGPPNWNEAYHIWTNLVTYEWVLSRINGSCHMWLSRVFFFLFFSSTPTALVCRSLRAAKFAAAVGDAAWREGVGDSQFKMKTLNRGVRAQLCTGGVGEGVTIFGEDWADFNISARKWTHCNALQHTATHCNTLSRAATHCNTRGA